MKIHHHCFGGDMNSYRKWSELYPNMKFGFVPGKGCTSTKRFIPLDKILIETDAPYFPPYLVRFIRSFPFTPCRNVNDFSE